MADLAAIYTDRSYRDPKTLVASCNVVLATENGAAEVEAALAAALARVGLVTDVIVPE